MSVTIVWDRVAKKGCRIPWPWESVPYHLISWWDMERFSAETFVLIGTLIQMLKEEMGLPKNGDAGFDFRAKTAVTMTGERREKVSNCLNFIAAECRKLSLNVSTRVVDQMNGDFMSHHELSRQYAIGRIAGFEGGLRAEMESNVFLHIPSIRQSWYEQPLKEWDTVIRRFPKISVDIEESSKCFAYDRYAAAIFHILLVAEFGVIQVAKLFGVQGDRAGWGALERLEKIHSKEYVKRSELEKKHSEFLGHVVPLMLAIKDAWRHKISHVENKLEWLDTAFSSQIAEEIISATRGFMRRLATDLPAS